MKKNFLLFIVAGIFHVFALQGQPIGFLDQSFGIEGRAVITLGAYSYGGFRAVAVQKDGKIVAAGDSGPNYGVARFQVNGMLDSTFGVNGQVGTQVGNINSSSTDANDVAIQEDGKILVTGDSGDKHFGLVRFTSDGVLDSTFGIFGKVITQMATSNEWSTSVDVQKDGKIVIAGYCFNVSKSFVGLARYNSDGALDPTFGNAGKVLIEMQSAAVSSVMVQEDNKILVGGYVSVLHNHFDFMLLRLQPDGKLDVNFGLDGIVRTSFGGNYDQAQALAIQSDGKIILAGNTDAIEYWGSVALARYHPDGSLDQSFGEGGKVVSDIKAGRDGARGVIVQKNGKILVVGYGTGFMLLRYNEDGTFDTSFGWGGQIATQFLSAGGSANSCVMQGDDKVIVAGQVGSINCGLARHYVGPALVKSNDLANMPNVTLFPNPAEDHFFIDLNDHPDLAHARYQILDVAGAVVASGLLSEGRQTQVSCSGLRQGVYLVSIEKDRHKICLRLVK